MYYAELNFPSIPKELLVDPFECVTNQEAPDVRSSRYRYIEQYVRNGQQVNPCSYWVTGVRSASLSSWLRTNIPGTKAANRFCYQHAYHKTGGCHIVHSDIARNYAINYMIELGGDDAWTSWYREKGQPVKRQSKQGGGYNASSISSYDNLELLNTVKFEQGKWYIMATDILHDVSNIIGLRKSITINVPKNIEKIVLEKLSCTTEN
jgi:hypothetical protein